MLDGLTWMGEPLNQDQLLNILRKERQRSIGIDAEDNSAELNGHRERALAFYKGEVDMPVAKDEDGKEVDTNRSKATSTDLADAVETLLPDLMEVFFGGEDALTFNPMNKGDIEAAEQETDYLRMVLFDRNDGFMNTYEWFKESLMCRTSIAKYWWEEEPEYEEYEGEASIIEMQELEAMGIEIISKEPLEEDRFKYKARKIVSPPTAQWRAVPSSDFGVAPETGRLHEATYCVLRSREQKQDLIARGYDEKVVRDLPPSDGVDQDGVDKERDTSDEYETEEESAGDLGFVVIHEHYIRANFDDTRPKVWRVITGNSEKALLDIEQRGRIEFAPLSPFPMMFRHHGMDIADKMIPIQRINTSLLRIGLDNMSFQLNQRPVVNDENSTEDTVDDLLNNTPGQIIRAKRPGAVEYPYNGTLSVDPWAVMEQVNTIGEKRSGVIRNAQGLNPDSLHETKGGMQIQDNNSQKRTRMIARLFAEMGVKQLFLGVHDLLRSNATMSDTVRLKGQFVSVDPSVWGRRSDMKIEIGIGSGGRDADLAALDMIADRISEVVQGQGGFNGPIVGPQEVYNTIKALGDRLGQKRITQFIKDPAQQPEQEEQPDPELIAKQQELQMKQAEVQEKNDIERERIRLEHEREIMQMRVEFDLKVQQMQGEFDLRRELAKMQVKTDSSIGSDVRMGGQVG